jgi:hypothetical protein
MDVDVRRLAAVDMHGLKGTSLRRRIIVAEFVLGVLVMVGVGGYFLFAMSGGWPFFALWLIGAGLNYVPLSAYAISLTKPGALVAELDGVDVPAELRRYGVLQLWIFVPLALVFFAVHRALAKS